MPFSLDIGGEPVPGYSLVRRLGRGGFGEVWEAVAPGGVRVALKFIHLDTMESGAEQRALELVRNIRHPHLLDVQFAARVEDFLVIAMPLCEESLWDRLRECKEQGLAGVPRDELLGYMDEVARAVDFLNEPRHPTGDGHLAGVQHRDIKPHNIFLVGGSVRLADFGLAKALEATVGDHSGCMSPQYVAPEVIEGHVSQWTDQYSLAVTYCHLRNGRLPYKGKTISQLIYAHLHDPPDLEGLPEAEKAVLARALAKRPEERWSNCRALAEALEEAARDEEVGGSTEPVVGPGAVALTNYPHLSTTDQATRTRGSGPPSGDPRPSTRPPAQAGPVSAPASAAGPPPAAGPLPGRRSRKLAWGGLAAAVAGLAVLVPVVLSRPGQGDRKTPPVVASTDRPATPTRPKEAPPAAEPASRSETPPAAEPASRSEAPPTAKLASRSDAPPATREASKEPKDTEPADPPKPADRPEPPAPPASTSTEAGEARRVALATPARPVPAGELATQAHALLKKYCYRCHGVRFEVPGYNVLDRDGLVAKRGEDERPYVVPGKPGDSEMWERVGVEKDMPPSGPKPSDEERALIGRWIEAGAPFPTASPVDRPTKADKDVLAAIRDHLRALPEADRRSKRYVTLHTLYNNKAVGDDELRLARAAVAKLANSLSWKPDIVVPEPIDREQTVLAVDLRDLGWDERDLWKEILSHYPYGLKHDKDPDRAIRELAKEVEGLAGTSVPFVRADWFVATASRPPLYHTLLDLPDHARKLERLLKVDPDADFVRNRLARAGFATSGVSSQNRLVDRHPALYGAYWKSYDFKHNDGKGNLFRFPLGPTFATNPFGRLAFEHAGGELIFNLPNGLQGYLLVDDKGKRIDAGPIEVVGDALKTSGTSAIVPGLSCMACHQNGMIPFKDTIREGLGVSGDAREKVETLFLEKAKMDLLLAKDEAKFLAALEAATGRFLKQGDDRDKSIRDFPEPVGAVARGYLKDLGPDDVAAELGLGDPKELSAMIRANMRLRQLGLAPLLQGATIKRTEWDSLEDRAISTYQDAAHEIGLGTPFRAY